MTSLAYPTPQELVSLSEHAHEAHTEIHRLVCSIVRLHRPEGPPYITGSLALKLHMTSEAAYAYDTMRRDRYPTQHEVEYRTEVAEAFVLLEQTGVPIEAWDFFGEYSDNGHPYYEFAHARRRDGNFAGVRTLHLYLPHRTTAS